ncbi:hypothetical protein BRC67_09450, partial [Halobacteriales archaeon QH_3_68_24]
MFAHHLAEALGHRPVTQQRVEALGGPALVYFLDDEHFHPPFVKLVWQHDRLLGCRRRRRRCC